MAIRLAITVSITSVLLGASRHTHTFIQTHSFPRMCRSTLYPLDCGLTDPLENTCHRCSPLGRSPILPCAHEGCLGHRLRCCCRGYARRRDDSLESARWRGGKFNVRRWQYLYVPPLTPLAFCKVTLLSLTDIVLYGTAVAIYIQSVLPSTFNLSNCVIYRLLT